MAAVTLPAASMAPFPRFTLYNSPYAAHERGCAVDLYPGTERAPSPVAGEVVRIETVRAPPKPYAEPEDHLIAVDTGDHLARLLHVDPAVAVGDRVAVGDDLGPLIRAGFFAPWVDNHVHLGFRPRDADPVRATGSLELAVDVRTVGLDWDGSGTVVEVGETYAVLDAPRHPEPGEYYVGVAPDAPSRRGGDAAVVDGGLPHYDRGGRLGAGGAPDGPVPLLGRAVGDAAGRHVDWRDVTVRVDGEPIVGLSLFLARDAGFGAKLICPDRRFEPGEAVRVSVDVADE